MNRNDLDPGLAGSQQKRARSRTNLTRITEDLNGVAKSLGLRATPFQLHQVALRQHSAQSTTQPNARKERLQVLVSTL